MKPIKTKVVHSLTKTAWNVVGCDLGCKYKIARVPYVTSYDEETNEINENEAFEHACFISHCFNHSEHILKKP